MVGNSHSLDQKNTKDLNLKLIQEQTRLFLMLYLRISH